MPTRRRPIYLTFKVPPRAKRRLDRLAIAVVLKRPSLTLEEARGIVLVRAARAELREPRNARRHRKTA